ncbi:MAG TPA: hypothetical protein VGH74_02860, partial [Planctomycetaceae bacterium]
MTVLLRNGYDARIARPHTGARMPGQCPNRNDGCREFRRAAAARFARREFLRLGGVSLLSPGLLSVVAGRATGAQRRARIKSCLLLFQAGGVSQTDTFDMKP